jgi:hypothetical protein
MEKGVQRLDFETVDQMVQVHGMSTHFSTNHPSLLKHSQITKELVCQVVHPNRKRPQPKHPTFSKATTQKCSTRSTS